MRNERLRPDWGIRAYAFHAHLNVPDDAVFQNIPASIITQARAMRDLWNRMVETFNAAVSDAEIFTKEMKTAKEEKNSARLDELKTRRNEVWRNARDRSIAPTS